MVASLRNRHEMLALHQDVLSLLDAQIEQANAAAPEVGTLLEPLAEVLRMDRQIQTLLDQIDSPDTAPEQHGQAADTPRLTTEAEEAARVHQELAQVLQRTWGELQVRLEQLSPQTRQLIAEGLDLHTELSEAFAQHVRQAPAPAEPPTGVEPAVAPASSGHMAAGGRGDRWFNASWRLGGRGCLTHVLGKRL